MKNTLLGFLVAGLVAIFLATVVGLASPQTQTYEYEFNTEVTKQSVDELIQVLNKMSEGDTIVITITSPGGSLFDGYRLYGALEKNKGHVVMRVSSIAASAAAFLLCFADEVHISDYSIILFHLASVNGIKVNEIDDPFAKKIMESNGYLLNHQCHKFLTDVQISRINSGEDLTMTGEEVKRNLLRKM